MNLEKKEYAAVDLYKLLMAIFIVVSHTNPFIDFNKWIEVGIRDCIVIVAVPFFFSVTGFLLMLRISVWRWPLLIHLPRLRFTHRP